MEADTAGKPPGMPNWVKVFLIVGVAFGVLLIGVLVLGGSEHGPGRHGGSHEGPSASSSPTANHTEPGIRLISPDDDVVLFHLGSPKADQSPASRMQT